MKHEIVYDSGGEIIEILHNIGDIYVPLLGGNGKKRERDLYIYAEQKREEKGNKSIAIFLGVGSGEAIKKYSENTESICIVVDDTGLLQEVGIKAKNVHYIESTEKNSVKEAIETIMKEEKCASVFCVMHPFYARNYKDSYRSVMSCVDTIGINEKRVNSVTKKRVKILFVGSACFIRNEFIEAAKKENIEYKSIILPSNLTAGEYKRVFLEEYVALQPSFIITTNHTCFDRTDIFAEMIEKLEMPVASYFMDNPYLDIERQLESTRKYTSVFTYDADTIEYIKSCSFSHVYYLPLGTDTERFTLGKNPKNIKIEKNTVGFLGASHQGYIHEHQEYPYPIILQEEAKEISLRYEESPDSIPHTLIKREYPRCYKEYIQLNDSVRREYDQYIIYLATNRKRKESIIAASILPITVAGDSGWNIFSKKNRIRLMRGIPYSHAHYFYRQMEMTLNSVCTQMKRAVNQRVFDAPAAGSFVLTEYTEQLENLFDIGKEIICYRNREELQEYLLYYHKNESERNAILARGRARIIQEHDYRYRLQEIIRKMQEVYGER